MKSILITILIFGVLTAAVSYHVFDVLSSGYMHIIGFLMLIGAFFAAFKILGNPFHPKEKNEGDHDDKE